MAELLFDARETDVRGCETEKRSDFVAGQQEKSATTVVAFRSQTDGRQIQSTAERKRYMQGKRIVLDLLCRVILRNEDHFDLKVAQQSGIGVAAEYILEESGAQAGKALFVAVEFGLDTSCLDL